MPVPGRNAVSPGRRNVSSRSPLCHEVVDTPLFQVQSGNGLRAARLIDLSEVHHGSTREPTPGEARSAANNPNPSPSMRMRPLRAAPPTPVPAPTTTKRSSPPAARRRARWREPRVLPRASTWRILTGAAGAGDRRRSPTRRQGSSSACTSSRPPCSAANPPLAGSELGKRRSCSPPGQRATSAERERRTLSLGWESTLSFDLSDEERCWF
jgi:hypothetical protein